MDRTKIKLMTLALMMASQMMAVTRVQEVLYRADGGKVAGLLRIEWPTFTVNGRTVPGGFKDVNLRDGLMLVDLEPYTGYTVRYKLGGADAMTEYWAVPVSASVLKIQDVRTSAIPQPGLSIALPALGSGGATINQVLTWNGAGWVPADPAGGTGGSGLAAGTVDGQALVWNGPLSQWKAQAMTYAFDLNVQAYIDGTVDVTNGSTDITGTGTTWTPAMTGRMFIIGGCNLGYKFTYVDATHGTLEDPYGCPTASGQGYLLNDVVEVLPGQHNLNTGDYTVTCYADSPVMPGQRSKMGWERVATQVIHTDTFKLVMVFYQSETGRCILQR